ncbi:MAG: DUF6055 domain-containing protein, partial [Thermoanaerobaculia bacterium]
MRVLHFVGAVVSLVFAFDVAAQSTPAGERRRLVHRPEIKSTTQLLAEAVARGEITSETALVYRVFADFDDPRLPEKYRGTERESFDSLVLAEAALSYESLSESARTTLAPFLIPPFQRGSWADESGSKSSAKVQPNIDPLQFCGPVNTSEWSSVLAESERLRIWWKNSNPGDAVVAKKLADTGDTALARFEMLLGRDPLPDLGFIQPCRGGDDAIDVALVDVTSQAVPFFPATKDVPTFVLLERSAPDGPEVTLAHELFHVMQFTYPVNAFSVLRSYKWMMEATAQWAQDYYVAYGNGGKEHRAAPLYLARTDESLTTEDDEHEYGAYLFFQYLSRSYENSIIKQIWHATIAHDAVSAVDTAIPGGFKERWPEFARAAWNRDPTAKFREWDLLSDGASAAGGTLPRAGSPDTHAELNVELPSLSTAYKHFVFSPDARSATFLNGVTFKLTKKAQPEGEYSLDDFGTIYVLEDATEATRKGAAVWALIKRGGAWQDPEDWSGHRRVDLCLQSGSAKIEEVVLIISNSDTAAERVLRPEALDPVFVVSNVACSGWEGTATFDGRWDSVRRLSAKWEVKATLIEKGYLPN